MSRVSSDVSLLQHFFSSAVPQLATNIFYLLFGFIILFTLNNKLSLALLAILPVLVFINYFFAARARAVSYREMERHAQISKRYAGGFFRCRGDKGLCFGKKGGGEGFRRDQDPFFHKIEVNSPHCHVRFPDTGHQARLHPVHRPARGECDP